MKSGAFVFLAFKPDMALVPLHNGFNDRHTQAHRRLALNADTAGFRKFIKQGCMKLTRNTNAGIRYRN